MNTNPSAKTILCYGDSNTWGCTPVTLKRYPANIRWPGILQNLLGNDYEIISEGLQGRTMVAVNPEKPRHTGITHLEAILRSHRPIDFIIIMLGTNDVKTIYNLNAEKIAVHLDQTIKFINEKLGELDPLPKILVICPPPIILPKDKPLEEIMITGLEIFKELPNLYKNIAEQNNCSYMNAGEYITSSEIDGYHLSEDAHKRLGEIIAEKIKTI